MTKYWPHKLYSTLIFDANYVSRKLAECLKACLNPPRWRGEKRIETLASKDEAEEASDNSTMKKERLGMVIEQIIKVYTNSMNSMMLWVL